MPVAAAISRQPHTAATLTPMNVRRHVTDRKAITGDAVQVLLGREMIQVLRCVPPKGKGSLNSFLTSAAFHAQQQRATTS